MSLFKKTVILALLNSFACSCSEQYCVINLPYDGITLTICAPDFVSSDDSRIAISPSGTISWASGDRIGLYSNKAGDPIQTPSQLALTLSGGTGSSAAYSSSIGWELVPGGEYTYFSYYPYSEKNTREKICMDYTGQVQTANDSTEGLGVYDYMYSDMATPSTSSSATFSFHHIGCLTNVSITVPSGYENVVFYSMRLLAESDIFASSATYSVDDVIASGAPSICPTYCKEIKLSFGNKGIKPTNGVINAWIMMAPAQWKDQTITVKLYDYAYNVPALTGSFTSNVNQVAGTKYSYSVTSVATGKDLPDKPLPGEQLHILLFGHSLGVDSTEYLPELTVAAGITDVHYGRFYQANCSLQSHWQHVLDGDTYTYYNCAAGKTNWTSASRRTEDVLKEAPWDIVILQHGLQADQYSTYQPALNDFMAYIIDVCEETHGKTPIIGWNMFWGWNSDWNHDYDKDMTIRYNNIVSATRQMQDEVGIRLIIATGTAMQNARCSSLNDWGSPESPSTTQLLQRDNIHASEGIGRYTVAATWFQRIIGPIYNLSLMDNSWRPSKKSFAKDEVTEERAIICKKCAIAAAEYPFEVTPITE